MRRDPKFILYSPSLYIVMISMGSHMATEYDPGAEKSLSSSPVPPDMALPDNGSAPAELDPTKQTTSSAQHGMTTSNAPGGSLVEDTGKKRMSTSTSNLEQCPRKKSKYEDRVPPATLAPFGHQVKI